MARVVPSQVVELIDKIFPKYRDQKTDERRQLMSSHRYQLAALLDIIERVPSELIVLNGDDYVEFVASVAGIRQALEAWKSDQTRRLEIIEGLRPLSPVTLIRQALGKCPDEFPAASTSELKFIGDNELKDRLRLDIAAVNNALANGEWKAATVLAGSVIEALLLWVLEEHFLDKLDETKKALERKPRGNLDEWGLHEYVELAAELKVIEQDTATQVRLAKDYRNLIHPGRAKRKGQVCNRSTAMTAIAALDRVTEDLTKKFGQD